jgi:P4 family phage/plasmid primase-like protien
MDARLAKWLQKYRDASQYYTHTSQMLPTTGKFRIDRENMEEFWKLYCDLSFKNEEFMSGIAEKPRDYLPILVDVDLKLDIDKGDEKHFYTENHIKKLVSIYVDVLKYILEDDYFEEDLSCFVLEKKKPYISGSVVKDGFHLHFPFCFMSKIDQDIHLIPRVIERIKSENLFKDIVENNEEVIDKSCTKKHWLMYGSRKDNKLEAYSVTKIYNTKGKEIKLEESVKKFTLYNSDDEEIKISNVEYELPRILSIHPLNRKIFNTRQEIDCVVKKNYIRSTESRMIFDNMTVPQLLEQAKELLTFLSSTRADDYNEWIEVGWVIYNLSDGCVEGLDLWIEFSKKTSRNNFSESSCVYHWNKMTKRNYSIGTLRYWASQDSPERYKKWKQEKDSKRFKDILLGGHHDLAKDLYEDYSAQFVCASIDKDIWFEYKNHRWTEIQKGITLRSKISSELVLKFKEKGKALYDEMVEEDKDAEEIQKQQKQVNKILSSLKSATFKNHVMKECQELFFNADFLEKLDTNPNLIGFTNGVLDVTTCEFRAGRPDDYISKTTGYDYRDFDEDDPEVIEVKDFLVKVFPDKELRDYFLEYAAKLLRGGNHAKTFLVMSADGDNGKSVTIELVEKALGAGANSYSIKLPTTLLVGKRTQSSQACPELDRSHGVRFASLQEPEGKDTINSGILKELTGNDSIYTRGLFKEGKEIKPMFKLAFICNKLPRLTAEDQATWNRIRVLTFESKFPKDSSLVPTTFEEQMAKKIFYRDDNLSEKLGYMKQAFMWIMVQKWKHIQKYGSMPDPKKVTMATMMYRENNDFYLQFVNETIERTDDDDEGLTLVEIYAMFKEWYKENFPNNKLPIKNELKEDMIKRFGQTNVNNKWTGLRRKEEDRIVINENDLLAEE